jgi:hypothetical protein
MIRPCEEVLFCVDFNAFAKYFAPQKIAVAQKEIRYCIFEFLLGAAQLD